MPVQCRLCHKSFELITEAHLQASHNMSLDKYRAMFPSAPTSSPGTLAKLDDAPQDGSERIQGSGHSQAQRNRSLQIVHTLQEPIWEIQPAEPTDCYAWFRQYLTLGARRTISQLSEALGASLGPGQYTMSSFRTRLLETSAAWRWDERIAALEAYLGRQYVESQALVIRSMVQSHVDAARIMLNIGITRLLDLQNNEQQLKSLPPRLAMNLVVQGAHLERLSRGEATNISSTSEEERKKQQTETLTKIIEQHPEIVQLLFPDIPIDVPGVVLPADVIESVMESGSTGSEDTSAQKPQ